MTNDFSLYTTDHISEVMLLRKPQTQSLKILEEITNAVQLRKGMNLKDALSVVRALYPSCCEFGRDFMSLTFALPPDIGKTRLMGAFITYLYTQHHIRNFFVVAPAKILGELKKIFSNNNSAEYMSNGLGCFSTPPQIITDADYREKTPSLSESGVHIFVCNIDKFNKEGADMKKKNEPVEDSFYQALSNLPDLVLIMDESRYSPTAKDVQVLNELHPLLGLELTNTPLESKKNNQMPFKNVVYEYLSKAAIQGHGLIPFESETEINEAEIKLWGDDVDLYRAGISNIASEWDVILNTYSATGAWVPFIDCGCEPSELYTILRCNALVCALATFSYLDVCNDKEIEEEKLNNGMNETIYDMASEYYQKNMKCAYLGNYLIHIAYKETEDMQTGKNTEAGRKICQIKTNPVLAPIAEVILSRRRQEEFWTPAKKEIDNLFGALVKCYATYAPEGRSVRMGYSETKNPSSIPERTESKRRERLCDAYKNFYTEWMGMSISPQKNEYDEDVHVRAFLQELVFHHRALARSEQALKIVSEQREYALKGELNIDSAVDDIAQALYCACRIPLVFGADKLQFSKRKKVDHFFGQYLDFIKLAIIWFYEQANRDVEKACDTIRNLLRNPKFEEYFKESEETTEHCVIDLPKKNRVEIAAAAVEGIVKPDYYGKGGVSNAQSPDELFSIVTETSQENKRQVLIHEENGGVRIEVKPRDLKPNYSMRIARFESKEKRDAFLSDLETKQNAINVSSNPIILLIPIDNEAP